MNLHESAALKADIFSSLRCALPGYIESFDSEKGTATVRPALRSSDSGSAPLRPWPLLEDVPVFLPRFSDESLSLVVEPGDPCLLIFSDRALDGWPDSGQPVLPVSRRMHDLSDAVAFVGFFK